MRFIAPVIAVVVTIAHEFLGDTDPRRTQEVVLPATHSCQPMKERRVQLTTKSARFFLICSYI